jgi:(4S)-4-hydroxy-5-phosphonooxypentane-2,3-dione isomerase
MNGMAQGSEGARASRGKTRVPSNFIQIGCGVAVRLRTFPRRNRLVSMLIVHVHVRVKPEFVEAFRQATIENASNSVKEPGIARFDVVQQNDDATRFVLVEVYRTEDDPPRHRETDHYKKWRAEVEPMMAEPRTPVRFSNVFPTDQGW